MSLFVWRRRRALIADGGRLDEGDLVSSDCRELTKDSRLFMARGTRLRAAVWPTLSPGPTAEVLSLVTGRKPLR